MLVYAMLSVSWLIYFMISVSFAYGEGGEKHQVQISQGPVSGYKEDGIFSFYGIPYATAPTGKNRFKAPLPPPSWSTTFEATNKDVICPQHVLPHIVGEIMNMKEDCLIANVFVPDTTETNLPVLVYVHGGAFQLGYGNLFRLKNLLKQSRQKFIIVNFNYRLGIHGFLCLGTEDVPGNAGMKDQVALLRWVKENIASFGGNPGDVTIAGCSAGSASVDLLMISPLAKGLFHKAIPESGANMAAFAVQIDPLEIAKEFATASNFTDTEDLNLLEEFYKSASYEILTRDPFFDRKDSTFAFSPCVENKNSEHSFLTESPLTILKSGAYTKVPLLYGFANMEGISRVPMFEAWKDSLNENFADFLPADLQLKQEEIRQEVSKEVKDFYFGDRMINEENILQYIDYFTDVLFANGHLRALKLHIAAGHDKIYLYEYSFVDETAPIIPYTDNLRGADHCAQTAAIVDGSGFTSTNQNEDDISDEYKKMKLVMRELWSNFITTSAPVPVGSPLPAWPAVSSADGAPHMSLGRHLELKGALLQQRARFWDDIYERHYRAPQPPETASLPHTEL